MDAVGAAAGVSKLTVYSHFTDKETLFAAAIRVRCEEQMPAALFDVDTGVPLDEQLRAIARAFLAMATRPEAIALHRLLVSGSGVSPKLVQLFLAAGPERVRLGFEQFLRRHIAARRLGIADVPRAAQQFFALLKGESHTRLLCGCTEPVTAEMIEAEVAATVDFFLRACSPRPAG